MKMTRIILALLLSNFAIATLFAQSTQSVIAHPSILVTGTYWGESKPLRDLPPLSQQEKREMEQKAQKKVMNPKLQFRSYPFAASAFPKGNDPAWQNSMGTLLGSKAPILNFDGQSSPYFPPDCNGTIGPNHFMQTINAVYAIYDRTGTLVAGPTALNMLFGNVPGANRNDGDPIILFDEQAGRWLVTEFSIPFSGQNYILMAVSTTNDPTGTWHQYSFPVASMPDYPKFAVWQDGYYMGDNNGGNTDTYVFERSQMLVGGTAKMVGFSNPNLPPSIDGFMCVPPVDNDGVFAPAGSPGIYIAFNDDAIGGGSDQLWIYELQVNWANTALSTFARTQQIAVDPFSADFGMTWDNIPQKGTGQKLDGIPQVIMNVPQYRNFGSHQTIVCCHTVDVNGNNLAGIRWYELRKTSGDWTLRQQGTYAPDNDCRWMGSIMLNGHNKIGLAYSISSTSLNPGIRYCGQSPAAYVAGNNTLDIAEDTIFSGAYSQSGYNRWGDYSQLSVDPADDETFWFTTQYVGSGNARKTRIASFKFVTGPMVQTQPASNLQGITATLNGIINPQGLSTDYHFEYGTVSFNLNDSTEILNAGSGTGDVNVSAEITGLQPNKKYYFRLVAVNNGGTNYGSVLSFTTGEAPVLMVSPPGQQVASTEGSTYFLVTSNISWSVECDSNWCVPVTIAGIGSDTLFVNYSENTSVSPRVAVISVTGLGAGIVTVTLSQEGVPLFLNVSPPNREVTASAGTTSYLVASNISWNATSDSPWCTMASSGIGTDSLYVSFSENTSLVNRVANLTVSGNGVPSYTVTLTQDGMPLQLVVSPANQDVSAQNGSTSFTVQSNTSWSVTSDATWCAVTNNGSGNGNIVAEVLENISSETRMATIEVSVPGNALPVQQVTVTQARSSISVESLSDNMFQVYPNPTTGVFKVVPFNGNTGRFLLIVNDSHGHCVVDQVCEGKSEYEVDLSNAAQGAYQVVLKSAAEQGIKKLIITR